MCTSAPCDYSSNGVDLTDTEFQTHLAAFLASSDNKRFAGQIVLSDAGLVTNSRSWVFHTGVVKTTDQVKAMDLVNDFCDEWDGLAKKPWPNSWIYLYVFQFKIIAMELIMNFVLVLCAVGVISPIVLKQVSERTSGNGYTHITAELTQSLAQSCWNPRSDHPPH